MVLTEADYCPTTGDTPADSVTARYRRDWRRSPTAVLIPGKVLPADTPDHMVEHEAAMLGYVYEWSRRPDGVYLWVER